MGLEVVVAREPLATLETLEWFLARVRPLVVLQDVLVAEGSVADVAGEHLLLVVRLLLRVGARGGVALGGGARGGRGQRDGLQLGGGGGRLPPLLAGLGVHTDLGGGVLARAQGRGPRVDPWGQRRGTVSLKVLSRFFFAF